MVSSSIKPDYTFTVTPRRGEMIGEAIERDGFLVVAGPKQFAAHRGGALMPRLPQPVPTTKPCPACGGSGEVTKPTGNCWPGFSFQNCPTCNGEGTVPIVMEVVVPERECPECSRLPSWYEDYRCNTCWDDGTIPARTLLRGTAEAVPVVDEATIFKGDQPHSSYLSMPSGHLWLHEWRGYTNKLPCWHVTEVTDHFAGGPLPEVGDTSWVVKP